MRFIETPIAGAFLIEVEPVEDARGFFARTVCQDEFARHGLSADFVQQSISYNNRRGILRGMHYQIPPYEEEKLVRVTAGAIFDVIVDLRPDSDTSAHWFGIELSAANHRSLFIPKGVAHGFQTLVDGAEVLYQMSVPYHPAASQGFLWSDRTLGIDWPDPAGAILSERDRLLPTWRQR